MIKKRPNPSAADRFIAGAPDAQSAMSASRPGQSEGKRVGSRVYKVPKVPVTFTASAQLLEQFDAKAERRGVSRAALLALCMSREVESE